MLGIVAFSFAGAGMNALGSALGECGKYPDDPNCHGHREAYIPAGIAAVSAIYGLRAVHHCTQQLDAMHAQYLADHPEEAAPH